jgi:hypothetical protein
VAVTGESPGMAESLSVETDSGGVGHAREIGSSSWLFCEKDELSLGGRGWGREGKGVC